MNRLKKLSLTIFILVPFFLIGMKQIEVNRYVFLKLSNCPNLKIEKSKILYPFVWFQIEYRIFKKCRNIDRYVISNDLYWDCEKKGGISNHLFDVYIYQLKNAN